MTTHANGDTQVKKNKFSFFNYIKETKQELKKVTWPTKKELFKSTSVVLTVVILSTILVWAMDSLLSAALKFILK